MACTTVIVGKDKSADGSVMVAHSEEDDKNCAQKIVFVPEVHHNPGDVYVTYSGGKIPQPAVTYSYIATKIFDKSFSPATILSASTNSRSQLLTICHQRGVPEATAWDPPIQGGVIWTEFSQLVLEQAEPPRKVFRFSVN